MRTGVLQQVGTPMELYNNPINLFVAGFIGSPAMNFMPATVQNDTVKLPIGDVRLPQELREKVGRAEGKQLIAGIRPENFEDAALVGEARDKGSTFRARIEVLEAMGSELYAHFTVASDQQIESEELRELAEDVGGGEVPMAGEEGRIVARLDPQSDVHPGRDSELWVDATRLQLFDPDDGRSLTADGAGPAAVNGGQGGGGRDPGVPPTEDERPAGGVETAEQPPPTEPR
jgi:multiple sugar transport system ATP-binding protein